MFHITQITSFHFGSFRAFSCVCVFGCLRSYKDNGSPSFVVDTLEQLFIMRVAGLLSSELMREIYHGKRSDC